MSLTASNRCIPLLPLICILLAGVSAFAQNKVTCALIPGKAPDVAASAVFSLVEAELSKEPGLALVERAEITKILAEQALQIKVGSESLGDRRKLGDRLKARMLVTIRAVEFGKPAPAPGAGQNAASSKQTTASLQVVASDTATGLRLADDLHAWNDANPASAVQGIVAEVRSALKKQAEPVQAILAIPPFVSDDLTHRFDYLQDAFAATARQKASAVPGVFVVELEEANALQTELKLAGESNLNPRLLPYFLAGHYRTDAKSVPLKTRLDMEVRRGGDKTFSKSADALPLDKTAEFLGGVVDELLGKAGASPAALKSDPEFEKKELARRAKEFERLGYWEKSLNLIEASLLLDKKQTDLHKTALDMCAKLTEEFAAQVPPSQSQSVPKQAPYDMVMKALLAQQQAVEHLAAVLNYLFESDKKQYRRGDYEYLLINRCWPVPKAIWEPVKDGPPEIKETASSLARDRREALLRYFEKYAETGLVDSNEIWHLPNPLKDDLIVQETPAEKYDNIFRYVRCLSMHSFSPDNEMIKNLGPYLNDSPECANLLTRLETLGVRGRFIAGFGRIVVKPAEPAEKFKELETLTRKYMRAGNSFALYDNAVVNEISEAAYGKAREEQNKGYTPTKADLPYLIFSSHTIAANRPPAYSAQKDKSGDAVQKHESAPQDIANPAVTFKKIFTVPMRVQGWIPAGKDADLIWSEFQVLCVSKGTETPRPLLDLRKKQAPAPISPIRKVDFDGRYAWVATTKEIIFLDLQKGEAGRLNAQNGLPEGEFTLAGLEPGMACVVGASDRSWCATVRWAPGATPVVDVFHQARQKRTDSGSPELVFKPTFAVAVPDPSGAGKPKVMVGREINEPDVQTSLQSSIQSFPLLLDPYGKKAAALDDPMYNDVREKNFFPLDGGIAWYEENNISFGSSGYKGYSLLRMAGPDFQKTPLNNQADLSAFKTSGSKYNIFFPVTSAPFPPDSGLYLCLTDKWHILDSKKERMIPVPGQTITPEMMFTPLFGQSSCYGSVFAHADNANINSENTVSQCYQVVPNPAVLKASAAAPFDAEQKTKPSWENRRMAIRVFDDPVNAPEKYRVTHALFNNAHMFLKRNALPPGAAAVLTGKDQTDPMLKKDLTNDVVFLRIYPEPHRLPENAGWVLDARNNHGSPNQIALKTAADKPLSGATVRLSAGLLAVRWKGSQSPVTPKPTPIPETGEMPGRLWVELGEFETDDKGELPCHPTFLTSGENYIVDMRWKLEVNHPQIGQKTLAYQNAMSLPKRPWDDKGPIKATTKQIFTSGGLNTSHIPFPPRNNAASQKPRATSPSSTTQTLLPLVAANPRATVEGVVLDENGKPFPGVEVRTADWCFTNAREKDAFKYMNCLRLEKPVVTGENGEFRGNLNVKRADGYFAKNIPETTCTLAFLPPRNSGAFPWLQTLGGNKKTTVTIPRRALETRRVVFTPGPDDADTSLSVRVCALPAENQGFGISLDKWTSGSASGEYALPAGKYCFQFSGTPKTPAPITDPKSDARNPQPAAYKTRIVEIKAGGPREIVLPLERETPVKPLRSAGWGRFAIPILSYEGQVRDALTQAPIPGVIIVARYMANTVYHDYTMTAGDWTFLNKLPDKFYKLPRQLCFEVLGGSPGGVRSDGQGRFLLEPSPFEIHVPGGMIGFNSEQYIARMYENSELTLDDDLKASLPSVGLLPMATLSFSFDPGYTISANWCQAEGSAVPPPDAQEALKKYKRQHFNLTPRLSSPVTIGVPAGIPGYLEIIPLEPEKKSLRTRDFNLKQGETLDLGELAF